MRYTAMTEATDGTPIRLGPSWPTEDDAATYLENECIPYIAKNPSEFHASSMVWVSSVKDVYAANPETRALRLVSPRYIRGEDTGASGFAGEGAITLNLTRRDARHLLEVMMVWAADRPTTVTNERLRRQVRKLLSG